MNDKILQFVTKLVSDPAHASRGVLASFLVIGLTAATLNLGTINAELFGARLLTPLTVDEITRQKYMADREELGSLVNGCLTNRQDGKGEALLSAFEDSFRGVLPGAGKLLLEEPATVQERKTKLIFETITKYGELKYCLNKDRFIKSYGQEYQNDFSIDLQAYMQTKNQETFKESVAQWNRADKDTRGDLPKESDRLFIGIIKDEYAVVEKDMRETHAYITDIVNRAIDSAVAIDQQTELRLASLSSSTQLRLLAMGNAIGDIGNEISNRQIVQGEVQNNFLQKQSEMLDKIADIKAYENWNKCFDDPTATICSNGKFGSNTYDQESFDKYKDYNEDEFDILRNTVVGETDDGTVVAYKGKKLRLESSLRNFTGLADTLAQTQAEIQKAMSGASTASETGKDEAALKAGTAAMNDGKRGSFRFGLLNLVDADSRARFLDSKGGFKLATLMYFAANAMVDVFIPGQEVTNYTNYLDTITADAYENQICAAVDPDGTTCFGQ